MRETRSPVILAAHIDPAINDGAWIEVECVEAAERGGNTHRGGWKIHVCALDTTGVVIRAVYVIGRDLTPHIFRTTTGLMSFCMEMQMRPFICPYEVGEIEVWKFATSKMPAPD